MKLSIVICEDEAEHRNLLKNYTDTLCRSLEIEAEITVFANSEALLADYPKHMDILLLDIMMDKMNGLELAHTIRKRDQELCIFFITSMAQYAIDGYRVRAYSFLTKPLAYEELRIEMTSAIRMLQKKNGKELLVKTQQSLHRIPSSQIIYAEVQNHWLTLHTADGTIEYSGNLSDLEKELQNYGFARCHAAYLVSLSHIRTIENDRVCLTNQATVPISRSKRKSFLQAAAEYSGGLF